MISKYTYIIRYINNTNNILYVSDYYENKEPYKNSNWRTKNILYSTIFITEQHAKERIKNYKYGIFEILKINLDKY